MKKRFALLLAVLLPCSACAATLQDGLYRDQADGYGGKVIVTVTVRDGQLREITTENTGGEKSEYYLKAEEALTKTILEKQTLEGIDAVAGATGTSESILSAMRGIWEQLLFDGTVHSVQQPTMTAWPKPTV